MTDAKAAFTALLKFVVEHIDIPLSHVSPQGSFRYGTVIRPRTADAEHDLDNVTTLKLPKDAMTQRQLKDVYGLEIATLCLR